MRKIVIRDVSHNFVGGDIENLIETTLQDYIKKTAPNFYVLRDADAESHNVISLEITRKSAKHRINPEDMERILRSLKPGEAFSDRLNAALKEMVKEANRLPDDGNPF